MALHFTPAEFERRQSLVLNAMQERGLDALLIFQQESMFWLTGYDTFGFCFFQCLVLKADGRMALLTRSADLRQAQHTSRIPDIRVWRDGAQADPVRELTALVAEMGLINRRIGVEYASYGLNAAHGRRLDAMLSPVCVLDDASGVIDALRVVKSTEEIAWVRRAAMLSDAADAAALRLIAPGADEGTILAAQQGTIFVGGGDYPANEFIIGSGRDALLCRYKAGRRRLSERDQITLEFAGAYRHYHAAIMRTVPVGEPHPLHLRYHAAARDALLACESEMRPGRTAGDIYAAHARVFDEAGLGSHRLNACGYSLGAKFTPSWMDPPMFYADNPWPILEGMVLFAHMILMDSQSETAMCLGRTYLVTAQGAEPLNLPELDLVVKGAPARA
jgi:Xaa-Pro dipeptidase